MNYWIVLSSTLLETLPLIIVFLLVFRGYIRIPAWLCVLFTVLMTAAAGYICIGTISTMETNAYIKSVSSLISVIFQCLVVRGITSLSTYQILFVIFVMHDIADDIILAAYMSYGRVTMLTDILQWQYVGRIAVFSLLFVPLFYLILKKGFQPLLLLSVDNDVWRQVCILPVFIYVIFRLSISPDYFNQPYVWHSSMWIIPYIWTGSTFALLYFTLRSMRTISEKIYLEKELQTAEMIFSEHEKQYNALRKYIEETSRSRHDFKYSLLMFRQYAEEGDCNKILNYIQDNIEVIDSRHIQQVCANTALDAVMRYYIRLARNADIDIRIAANVPEDMKISDKDLCILVGNLLDNALEACRRQKKTDSFIRSRIQKVGAGMLAIQISNSYEGEIRRKQGIYLSSKRNEQGIGLSSISYIVNQYHGELQIQYDENVFTVNILLNC